MSQLLLDKLDGLARAWLNWMSSMSLHVALLVVFLLVCDRCLRRLSGRLRFAMWLLVLARLVVPPDLALPTVGCGGRANGGQVGPPGPRSCRYRYRRTLLRR